MLFLSINVATFRRKQTDEHRHTPTNKRKNYPRFQKRQFTQLSGNRQNYKKAHTVSVYRKSRSSDPTSLDLKRSAELKNHFAESAQRARARKRRKNLWLLYGRGRRKQTRERKKEIAEKSEREPRAVADPGLGAAFSCLQAI